MFKLILCSILSQSNMIYRLIKQIPQNQRAKLYSDPILTSCLFRSLPQFQQQIILRFTVEPSCLKLKQFHQCIRKSEHPLLKSSIDKFQELHIINYITEQKGYQINKQFSESLEKFIMNPGLPKQQQKSFMTQAEENYIKSEEPLLHLLYQSSLKEQLERCNLSYIDLKNSEGKLTDKNFSFIRATNAQRISILIHGYLSKYRGDPTVLREVLLLSLLKPGKLYSQKQVNKRILKELQQLKLLKKIQGGYFAISYNFHHFAFEEKIFEEKRSLECKIIIQTNFKVYVQVISNDKKSYDILKSIMKELIVLEHEQYDFQHLIVGIITQEKIQSLMRRNITSDQFFSFFKQYMQKGLAVQKDLGKWKKLKFMGLEGPNDDETIPNNVKQQVKLWEKIKRQNMDYGKFDQQSQQSEDQ